jgi:hypothetical protein
MIDKRYKFSCGVTLVELIITMVIGVTLILAVGALLVGGQRAWRNTYASAHKKIKEDARAVTITFGSMGRRSNRLYKEPKTPPANMDYGYRIYTIDSSGNYFTPAIPDPKKTDPQSVFGNAVEFRYWDVPLNETDSYKLLDVRKPATAYALFYLDVDGKKLKVDYGTYPPGAVPGGSGAKYATDVTTVVLAENVSLAPGSSGAFSHTTVNKIGQGSVRINVVLTDPDDGETIKVMTSTMLRNIWPR